MEIRKYKAGDEYPIIALFKLVFKKEMSIEYWKWRFQDNPFTNDIMIHLMWEDQVLIGHYAVSPIEMNSNGKIVKTGLSMTTMTHPEYNGRGIFTQLSSSLYEELKSVYNYEMVWGFPNNNSHYAFIKNLNWKNIATIPMLSLKKTSLKQTIEKIYYTEHTQFDDFLSKLLNESKKNISINKTKKYLNWRYIQNPFAQYKILTLNNNSILVVYKVIASFFDEKKIEIDIMEIQFDCNIEFLQQLLNAIVINEKCEIYQFNIWNTIFSDTYLILKKYGFISQLPITYLGYLNLNSKTLTAEQYSNWDIDFGYSDIF